MDGKRSYTVKELQEILQISGLRPAQTEGIQLGDRRRQIPDLEKSFDAWLDNMSEE